MKRMIFGEKNTDNWSQTKGLMFKYTHDSKIRTQNPIEKKGRKHIQTLHKEWRINIPKQIIYAYIHS